MQWQHSFILGSQSILSSRVVSTARSRQRSQRYVYWILSCCLQFNLVAQSCPTLCDPMDCSTPGLPVHHQLPEFTQTHTHWVADAIQPSHPLSSPSLPALNLSQHQGLFKWVSSLHQVAKVLEFQLQHQSLQWTAAAAAKSLQLCPTLCDPIHGSPPGSPIPGILQARILEWVAISFSNAWKWKVKVKSLSPVRLLATPWTAAYQAPPSMGFSRQEYWSGVPLPSPLAMNTQDLISFRMDWLDLLAVQGTLKSLLQHHNSKASILLCSAFFIVQLSYPYMTTGKTIALTRWIFVGKVMSLLFNMMSCCLDRT